MYHRYLKSIVFIFLATAITTSCKKETVAPSSPDLNYFPTTVGMWSEYSVDSIIHADNDNNNDDSVYTYQYFIKEVIQESIIDGEGKPAQLIYRFKKVNENDEYKFIEAWTQQLNSIGAYRTESNITYQKLGFPIRRNTEWNGNCKNIYDEQLYAYANLHKTFDINSLSFDSTISVLQIDENNYIERKYGMEIYATGVGMVYKENDQLEKRLGIVVKGTEFRMQLIAFGK